MLNAKLTYALRVMHGFNNLPICVCQCLLLPVSYYLLITCIVKVFFLEILANVKTEFTVPGILLENSALWVIPALIS